MNRRWRVTVGCGVAVLLSAATVVGVARSDSRPAGPHGPIGSGVPGTPDPMDTDPLGALLPRPFTTVEAGEGRSFAPTWRAGDSARLLTNEYASHHGDSADAVHSPDWIVTSGSLFSIGGLLWSGHPDDRSPGPTSTSGTDSAVFRAVSSRRDYADVEVSFGLRVVALGTTSRTPPADTDGVHIFLHYQSEFETYYVSMFRRDGRVAIKKKVRGGPSNGGTYFTLAAKPYPVQPAWPDDWHQVNASIVRVTPASVRLTLRVDGQPALDVVDDGADAHILGDPGQVGLRGDNCEFYVRDFRAEPLAQR